MSNTEALPPLPVIDPHDHPEPRSYYWSRQEIAWIQGYAVSYARAIEAAHGIGTPEKEAP